VAVVLLGLELCGALLPRAAAAQEATALPPARQTIFPRSSEPSESHARAHVALAAGVAFTATSFVFSAAADRAYERYQNDTDPARIARDYDAARRDDRWSAGFLLGGTGALALGVYWRFVHHRNPTSPETRLGVATSFAPGRARLALRVDLP
jgi:hypothetical protein